MAVNCSTGMAPTAVIYLKGLEPAYIGLVATCAVMTLMVMAIYTEQFVYLYMHLESWKSRFHVMFLLSVYPVHALLSMVTMFVPRSIPINDMATGIYISVALYMFVRLLIANYGGKQCMMSRLIGNDMALAAPPICCCCICLPTIQISRLTVHTLEGAVLQYGIFRTITGYFSAVAYADKQDTFDMNAIFSRGALLVISTLMAMYALQLLYKVSVEPLKSLPLTPKFRVLQLVLVIDNVQSSLLNFLGTTGIIPCDSGLSRDLNAYRIHRMISVVEMLLLSLVARKYYRGHMEAVRLNQTAGVLPQNDSTSTGRFVPPERSEVTGSTEVTSPSSAPDVTQCGDGVITSRDVAESVPVPNFGFNIDIPDDITLQDDMDEPAGYQHQ